MKSFRENPDGEENQMATKQSEREVFALRRVLPRLLMQQFTPGQRALIRKHGTVSDFAIACHMCVPGEISYDEAEAAIQKYRREFNAA